MDLNVSIELFDENVNSTSQFVRGWGFVVFRLKIIVCFKSLGGIVLNKIQNLALVICLKCPLQDCVLSCSQNGVRLCSIAILFRGWCARTVKKSDETLVVYEFVTNAE